jgi:chitinase
VKRGTGDGVRGTGTSLLALALLGLFLGCAHEPYRIVGYVYRDDDIYRIGAEKLTHINYAFGQVSPDGLIVLNRRAPSNLAQLQALKAKNPKMQLILSIGGWGADNFSNAAFNRSMREQFADSAMTLVRQYALDGIDLDWEYPGQPGPGIMYREVEDKEGFTLLLKTLREHLDALGRERHRHYALTIASAGGEQYFAHTEMNVLHTYVDWINIMAYDFAGEWSKTTSHHAALYAAAPLPSGEAFVQQHLAAGIPARKLVLGIPFYGRGWCGVDAHGNVEEPLSYLPFSTLVRDYIDKNGFVRHWDKKAHAPYLWNAEAATYITYEDPASIRDKAQFIRKHHLGGAMFWEQGADPNETLLTTLYEALR